MKNKWYIPIVIFIFLLVICFIRGLVEDNVGYETLRESTMEEMTATSGVVIKYETVYETGSNGTVEAKVASGSKVSKGMLLANVYSGTVEPEVMAKLERVNKKIEAVKASQEEGLSFSSDVSKLDSEISSKVGAVIEAGQKRDMSQIAGLKTALATLAERRAVVSGQKSAGAGTLEELEQTRRTLLEQVGTAQKELRAEQAGIFVSSTDGFETLITPYNMDSLTPSEVAELEETEQKSLADDATGQNVYACKIVDNFRYFVAMNLPADKGAGLAKDAEVSLRFSELSADAVKAKIYSVSAEEDGAVTVICECSRYLPALLEKRVVSVDFIRNRYEGYRVSVPSIRTEDGVVGVFVKRDSVMRFIPVNVLYSTQEIAVVSSADEQKSLKLYDEVIVKAAKYEDGLPIR